MTDPEVFYNREDLWTRGERSAASSQRGEQAAQAMEPNFVLMKLPGEQTGVEFVEILPFTPANRNNLIGWIAGRSDGAHYGTPSSTTSRRRGWSTGRCRSRRASIRTRSSPDSCRCGTSRARTCGAAACS